MKTFFLLLLVCAQALGAGFFAGQQGVIASSATPAVTPAPLALSVTCLQYLRADKLVDDGGADNDSVPNWPDEANSYDATQGTAAAQPTLKAGVYNGHACVRFDNVDDQMDHSTVSSKSCWMVVKGSTWNLSVSYVSGGSSRGYFPDIAAFTAGPGGYDSTNLRVANGSNRIATGAIHSILMTPTKVFVDGVEVSGYSYTQTLGTVAVTRLNNRTDVTAYRSAFDLIEIAHFDGTPTSGDLSDLQDWAQSRYGTP